MKSLSRENRLERTVQELLPRLYRTACYLCRDEHQAQDVVQETITRLLVSLEKDAMRIRNPLAWCLTVMARVASEHGRRGVVAPLEGEPAARGEAPETDLLAAEERAAVCRCVRELPPDEREAVCLHVFGELTIRETARATGVSTSTAHYRFRKGLDRLRRRLGPASAGLAPPAFSSSASIAALRRLPSPEVPESFASGIGQLVSSSAAASAATSLAGTTLPLGGILVFPSKTVLVVGSAIVLTGAIGLGVKLRVELSQARATQTTAQLEASRHLERIVEVEKENATLRQRLVLSERVRGRQEPEKAGATFPSLPPARVEEPERLLETALAAFESRDADGFRAAFLALLDAGKSAYPALFKLLATTGNYNQMLAALAPRDTSFAASFIHEVTARRGSLNGLLDAILQRASDPDGATLFAYDLVQVNRVRSDLSGSDLSAAALRIIERAIELEGDGAGWNDHVVGAAELLLAVLRAKEALPGLGALLQREGLSERNLVALLRATASIGGQDAVALLTLVRDRASPRLRTHLMSNLAVYDSGNPDVEAFLRETMDHLDDPGPMLRSLARRKETRAHLDKQLEDPTLRRPERLSILQTLFESSDDTLRETAWKHLEMAEPGTQDEILASLADREPRAVDLLLRRIESDTVSREIAGSFDRLDAKIVHAHRDVFEGAAGNPGVSSRTRSAAAAALAKVDAAAAARQLMVGFDDAPEPARPEIVSALRGGIQGDEAKAFLGSIAASDPSEKVRRAAGAQ
jgi:RNA polymerase sigma factor (sigma-70 family)